MWFLKLAKRQDRVSLFGISISLSVMEHISHSHSHTHTHTHTHTHENRPASILHLPPSTQFFYAPTCPTTLPKVIRKFLDVSFVCFQYISLKKKKKTFKNLSKILKSHLENMIRIHEFHGLVGVQTLLMVS